MTERVKLTEAGRIAALIATHLAAAYLGVAAFIFAGIQPALAKQGWPLSQQAGAAVQTLWLWPHTVRGMRQALRDQDTHHE